MKYACNSMSPKNSCAFFAYDRHIIRFELIHELVFENLPIQAYVIDVFRGIT
jgi:hypothetical protein